MNVKIKMVEGLQFDGQGTKLGSDAFGNSYTFWRSAGEMEVPLDLALKLENELPKRFEIVDRVLAEKLLKLNVESPEPVVQREPSPSEPETKTEQEPLPTLKELKALKKDPLNDWAARRGYDVDPTSQTKKEMLESLCKQIEERTGKKVE